MCVCVWGGGNMGYCPTKYFAPHFSFTTEITSIAVI